MREIKFRAWDKIEQSMHATSDLSWSKGKVYWKYVSRMPWQMPDDFVLMQYTGLKDMNGVEIYEGDILGGASGLYGRVIWAHGDNEWLGQGAGWLVVTRGDAESWIELEAGVSAIGEVIGNIYENPELLEAAA